VIYKGMGV